MTGKNVDRSGLGLNGSSFLAFVCKNQGKPSTAVRNHSETRFDPGLPESKHIDRHGGHWCLQTICPSVPPLQCCIVVTCIPTWMVEIYFSATALCLLCQMQALSKLLSLTDITTLSSDVENSQHCKNDMSINTVIYYENVNCHPGDRYSVWHLKTS